MNFGELVNNALKAIMNGINEGIAKIPDLVEVNPWVIITLSGIVLSIFLGKKNK